MGYRETLQAEIAEANRKLAILDSIPEDTFNFNTVILISGPNFKGYWVKTGEESWRNLKTNNQKDLASLLFEHVEAHIGYFEVYVLTPGASPIYVND